MALKLLTASSTIVVGVCAVFIVSCASITPKEMDTGNKTRTKFQEYKLDKYITNAGDLKKAETNFQEASKFHTNDKVRAKMALDKAMDVYDTAIFKGMPEITTEKKQTNELKKTAAQDIKAQVAMKDKYAEAMAAYNEAEAARMANEKPVSNTGKPYVFKASDKSEKTMKEREARRENYLKAADLYAKAEQLFEVARVEAKKKKDKSTSALNKANDALKKAETTKTPVIEEGNN